MRRTSSVALVVEPSTNSPRRGWYRRFVEHLAPDERLGELLFGLIMVLTLTLGASIGLAGDRPDTRALLTAALGCNTAWGLIDAALHLVGRLSERGRLRRLARAVQRTSTREEALALVARELDQRIPDLVRPELRATVDADVLERVWAMKLETNRPTTADVWSALAVFWLVFVTALPAVLPFLVIRDPALAMRSSNGILIGLLFHTGWRWAGYTGGSRWGTALFMGLLGIALVLVAIALGG